MNCKRCYLTNDYYDCKECKECKSRIKLIDKHQNESEFNDYDEMIDYYHYKTDVSKKKLIKWFKKHYGFPLKNKF